MADNQHHGHHGHGGEMTPEQQKQMIEQEIKLARNLGQIKYKIAVCLFNGLLIKYFTVKTQRANRGGLKHFLNVCAERFCNYDKSGYFKSSRG